MRRKIRFRASGRHAPRAVFGSNSMSASPPTESSSFCMTRVSSAQRTAAAKRRRCRSQRSALLTPEAGLIPRLPGRKCPLSKKRSLFSTKRDWEPISRSRGKALRLMRRGRSSPVRFLGFRLRDRGLFLSRASTPKPFWRRASGRPRLLADFSSEPSRAIGQGARVRSVASPSMPMSADLILRWWPKFALVGS